MKCEEIEKLLIVGDTESQKVREHLGHCKACRDFASVVKAINSPKPSRELDHKVLTMCRNELALSGGGWHYLQWFSCVAGLAAALVLTAVLWSHVTSSQLPVANAADTYAAADVEMALNAGLAMTNQELGELECELALLVSGM